MVMNEFYSGQRVVFRDWDDLVDEFGFNPWDSIDCEFGFPETMRPLCGMEFTINMIEGSMVSFYDHYRLNDKLGFAPSISTDMIRPVECYLNDITDDDIFEVIENG